MWMANACRATCRCAASPRSTRVVGVPVSVDTERGSGTDAAEVGENVARLIGAVAIDINIEDVNVSPAELANRIGAARRRRARGVELFINARTDL